MNKQYILTLQFHDEDLDGLIDLEDKIISLEDDDLFVDGHDIGNNQMNIFIFTNNPEEKFNIILKSLKNEILMKEMDCAYRKIDSDDYTRIWPKDVSDKFEIS